MGSAGGVGDRGPPCWPATVSPQATRGVHHTPEGPGARAATASPAPADIDAGGNWRSAFPSVTSSCAAEIDGGSAAPRPAAFTVASLLVAVVDRAQTLSGVHRPPMIEPYLALRGTTGDGMGLRSIRDQPHVRRVRDRYGIGRTRRSCEQLWPGMSVSPVVGLS